MKQRVRSLVVCFLFSVLLAPQYLGAQKLQCWPDQWWVGMKYNKVLLLIGGNDLSNCQAVVKQSGVKVINQFPGDTKGYLFVEIEIAKDALHGTFPITITRGNSTVGNVNFELKARQYNYYPARLTGADAIYQIFIDRFVNGNPKNDNVSGMYEPADRSNPSGVHGGDIAGVAKALPYLKDLSVTAVELSPLYESNQFTLSYERTSPTSHYKVDPRIGSISEIKNTINLYKENGFKVIITGILHKTGNQHPLTMNPPQNDWIFRRNVVAFEKPDHFLYADPYASWEDIEQHGSIWEAFDVPSLNQNNSLLRRYLVQHLLWWVETLHPDGIRIEQSHLNTGEMLSEASQALREDFPDLNIISDPVTGNIVHNKHWMTGNAPGFTHVTDGPLRQAFMDSFAEYSKTTDALMPIYETLASDIIYGNAPNQLIFAGDDGRSTRLFTLAEKDPAIFRMYMGFLLSVRGIPSFLYGTELLTEGYIPEGKGFVRRDFPGGWDFDAVSAFNKESLNNQQKEVYRFVSAILKWRRENPDVMQGGMIHFQPADDVYAYIRTGKNKKLLVLINNHPTSPRRIESSRFFRSLDQSISVKNIVTGDTASGIGNLILNHKSILLLEITGQ